MISSHSAFSNPSFSLLGLSIPNIPPVQFSGLGHEAPMFSLRNQIFAAAWWEYSSTDRGTGWHWDYILKSMPTSSQPRVEYWSDLRRGPDIIYDIKLNMFSADRPHDYQSYQGILKFISMVASSQRWGSSEHGRWSSSDHALASWVPLLYLVTDECRIKATVMPRSGISAILILSLADH